MREATAEEQLLLELINRTRSDPAAEAQRLAQIAQEDLWVAAAVAFFGVDLDVFAAAMADRPAAPPLAWSGALADSATTHSLGMIEFGMQSHLLPGEPGLAERIAAAGYTGYRRLAENVFAWGRDAAHSHAAFVIDWGYGPDGMQSPAGHRDVILNPAYAEIGVAMVDVGAITPVGPVSVTQHFGTRFGADAAVTGVALIDADGDGFYDPGEGVGGATVRAEGAGGVFETVTGAAGGYTLPLAPGAWTVSLSAAGFAAPAAQSLTIDAANLKLDFFGAVADLADQAEANFRAVGEVIKSGQGADVIAAGEADDLVLSGDGDDTISGGAGNDTIKPGRGNDVMDGGAGDDILVGFRGDEVLVGGAGNDTLLGNLDDDTLTGGAGDDRMQGGPGFDVFVFDTAEWGDDRIVLDFLPQSDTLDFRGSGLALADLSITQAGDNVLIEAGDSSILVNSQRFGALDVADFAGDVLLFG
ncbi:carboxypeptidase regulatory-like domain-containing protein [Rubrimonas cliftonensis]|uniref:Uncharacterized conserved protein YkwD, contains CAP (CSP/antigen 5/PR1) domain n=1 Tax=Rubrimonas cliftonensis TaxID=89524 RepID=A0A1H4CYH7_9RHOB|nr:carboxypeptidase regulatory-like domain-containing protein [Rubrimonas cliftonensis]SEA65441.1 Uncharacterized conserved protein YkwD, contains CAP (CSP/antigen 5/PR1) domain [Rubrimonas cliftonensis]